MSKDIIVIKYYEEFAFKVPGIPDSWPRWGVASVVNARENYKTIRRIRLKTITRDKAMALIRENGLVATHRDRDGVVFDTPRLTFKQKHAKVVIPNRLGAEL